MNQPQRLGSVVEIRPECIDEYCRLHTDTWPEVLAQNSDSNLRNYSIFLRKLPDGKDYLFSYVEYWGKDFEADMKRMSENKTVIKWWDKCKPMHIPFKDREEGEWWAGMKSVFFQE
ncbi:L-rhamnose mutarotase [Photobacterium sp. DNB23_23_1]